MYLEEKVNLLEEEIQGLKKVISSLQSAQHEDFMTPNETAAFLHCSAQTIHNRIKAGKIKADYSTGMARIPKSQFLGDNPRGDVCVAPAPSKTKPVDKRAAPVEGVSDIRKLLFG